MDPEQRKEFGAQIHAVREAINAALTARQTELQQAALAENWRMKPLILLCQVVVKASAVFTQLRRYRNVFANSLPKQVLPWQRAQKLKMTITTLKR